MNSAMVSFISSNENDVKSQVNRVTRSSTQYPGPSAGVEDVPSQIWKNEDILHAIFHCMTSGRQEVDGSSTYALSLDARMDLLSAALTCKTFLNPGLNVLWASLNSLLPLLRVLSSFQTVDGVHVLNGYATNMPRFEFYARRVLTISLGERLGQDNIATHVYITLARRFPSPLLPNLRRVRLLVNGDTEAMCAFLLTSPSLTSFDIIEGKTSQSLFYQSFLSSLIHDTPFLKHLSLRGKNLTIEAFDIIPQLSQLRSLDIQFPDTQIPSDFLNQLGLLDGLRTLSIDSGTGPPVSLKNKRFLRKHMPSCLIQATTTTFKSLVSFHLCGVPRDMGEILQRVNLESVLSISIEMRENSQYIGLCLEYIARTAPSLKAMRIVEARQHTISDFSIDSIQPLFDHNTNIEELIIRVHTTITAIIIAPSFPHMRSFSLIMASNMFSFDQFFNSLVDLARLWPRLESLSLTIDSTDLSIFDSTYTIRHALRRLEINDLRSNSSSIQPTECRKIALFIDKLFPHLESLKYNPYRNVVGDKNSEHWQYIDELRLTFREIRKMAIQEALRDFPHST